MEMKMMVIRKPVTVNVSHGDIDDIMSTALEGGITHWASAARVGGDYLGNCASEQISRGGTLYIEEIEDGTVFTLTREKFMDGLREFIRESAFDYDCLRREDNGTYTLDACQIDAEAADMIVQYAVFDELVYG